MVLVLYCSTYGHVETLANAIAEGALCGWRRSHSPWGAATIAGADGSRQANVKELAQARFQGAHVAKIATKLHSRLTKTTNQRTKP